MTTTAGRAVNLHCLHCVTPNGAHTFVRCCREGCGYARSLDAWLRERMPECPVPDPARDPCGEGLLGEVASARAAAWCEEREAGR